MKLFTWIAGALLLQFASAACAADLAGLPANTWVPLKCSSESLPSAGDRGGWAPQGWNKLLYDAAGKRVLFYDRYNDKKHGGVTIYGNCLFSLDPATGKVIPLKVDNWTKIDTNGYRTVELPENASEPTPCPRHVCGGFEYVPDQNAIYVCNGANGSAMKDGQLLAHGLTANMWRLDLAKNKWTQVAPDQHPTKESLDDSMAYCPDTKCLVLNMKGKIWIHDIASGKWHKAKQETPICNGGQTICYDPIRKRMLLNGGIPATGLWAFDPKTETVTRLPDCPAEQYECPLAYDSKHDIFLVAVGMKSHEFAPGTFCFDPKKDTWKEIKTTNPTPASGNWNGWLRTCYDAEHDCFVGMVIYDQVYLFRYAP